MNGWDRKWCARRNEEAKVIPAECAVQCLDKAFVLVQRTNHLPMSEFQLASGLQVFCTLRISLAASRSDSKTIYSESWA